MAMNHDPVEINMLPPAQAAPKDEPHETAPSVRTRTRPTDPPMGPNPSLPPADGESSTPAPIPQGPWLDVASDVDETDTRPHEGR